MALVNVEDEFTQSAIIGLNVDNPTTLQIGPDGRLYVGQQDGTIIIATITKTAAGWEVVGDVETVTLIQDIPNHDDDGDLNTTVTTRQLTGLVVVEDEFGDPMIYATSSDPRIGAGGGGEDVNLDTNSGILSRIVQGEDGTFENGTKTDLVIGLPRSEENHSSNGIAIRWELVDGELHQIAYIAQGGHTNKGAPSNNFAWTPEYYYSAAILRVDLTLLAEIEATEGLKGGTAYVDPYVYALPTLDDPTRGVDGEPDPANGTTGAADIEAADTFGGNDGLNQAKYDADGPVQIFSPGYRNPYDVVITESGNIYSFDNGPNNGWGEEPVASDGTEVDEESDVATNRPNIPDAASDFDQDNLHLVTAGFYAGHPNPTRAAGAAAGLWQDQAAPELRTLPHDWSTITGGITNPEEGVYKGPGSDGSLLSINSSSNGLTEYTAGGLSDLVGSEILAVVSFNGTITFIEISSDGTQTGTVVTDTDSLFLGGIPLDIWAVGEGGIDGSGLGSGSLFVADFSNDQILVVEPGDPPVPSNDQDNDGILDKNDPLQFDPTNGTSTILAAGETLFWSLNPADTFPGKGGPANGDYNIGFTGWMINGVGEINPALNADSYIVDLDNSIRGGAAGIFQIEQVTDGDAFTGNNNQQDALQTGFTLADGVEDFTIRVPIFNPFSSQGLDQDFGSVGFALGDGTQFNYLKVVVGVGGGVPRLQVLYEEGDVVVADIIVDINDDSDFADLATNSVGNALIELFLTVDLAAPGGPTAQAYYNYQLETGAPYQLAEPKAIGGPITLQGEVLEALLGQNTIAAEGGALKQSSAVVTFLATSIGPETPFAANFVDLEITAGGVSEQGPVVAAINAGGPALSQFGIDFSADAHFDNGTTFTDNSGGNGLQPVFDGTIYETERYGGASGNAALSYSIPVAPGEYTIELYFAEIFQSTPGQRVFDVFVEGQLVLDDFDILAETGGDINQPIVFEVPAVFSPTLFDEPDKLDITFQASADNAKISGIVVREAVAAPDPTGGEATFSVTLNSNDIDGSNFGDNSFLITNTGTKKIASIEIDVSSALYGDMVFDPFGQAGDHISKLLTISMLGGTGLVTTGETNGSGQPVYGSGSVGTVYLGTGGSSGFETIKLNFDLNASGGFETGETLGFAIDMDPNSIKGANKTILDSGADSSDDTSPPDNDWDIGGVSGAELIGATYTITFEDGTTATGQLQSNDNQGGALGIASQASPGLDVTLTVNGIGEGGFGSYTDGGPSVIVSGPAGETARIVLTKGFIQPGENNFSEPYASQLKAQLDALASGIFPANNAAEFQIVDVLLTGGPQDISSLFDFDTFLNGIDFGGGWTNLTPGEMPLGFAASVIDPADNDVPLGAVTDPIYLQYVEEGAPPEPTNVLFRVNAGGELVAAIDGGPDWTADTNASPSIYRVEGGSNVFSGTSGQAHPGPIDYTAFPELAGFVPSDIFNIERWDSPTAPEMSWSFPVTAGDFVQVNLYVAELFNGIDAVGERSFDVLVEGMLLPEFDDIDPFAMAGAKGAAVVSTTVTVDGDNSLDLQFLHDLAENPAIKGIEIVAIDTFSGDGTNNTLNGTDASERFLGFAGNDTINAGGGDDTLVGGAGGDVLNGGTGIDTADYSGSTAGVGVNLATGVVTGGHAQGDVLSSIENIVGSGFNDTLQGDAEKNSISGGAGNDALVGGAGQDSLHGGAGNDVFTANDGEVDTLHGGDGSDLVSFTNATQALVIDVANPGNSTPLVNQDVMTSIEGFLGATNHANTMVGDANTNFFIGGEQGDSITGGDGADFLIGRGGDDTIEGGAGQDVLEGGAGLDLLTGGTEKDAFQIRFGGDVEAVLDWSGTAGDTDVFLFRGTGLTFDDLAFVSFSMGQNVDGYVVASDSAGFTIGSGASETIVVVEGATTAELDDADNFVFL